MGLFTFLAVLALCGTVLAIAMMWLVNMPKSPLRDMLVQIVAGCRGVLRSTASARSTSCRRPFWVVRPGG